MSVTSNRLVRPSAAPGSRVLIVVVVLSIGHCALLAAFEPEKPAPAKHSKPVQPFRWVNPLQQEDLAGVTHATFRSPSMGIDVGCCIYLPPDYERVRDRYPVVYYLHGGRPGSEIKSVRLA